MLELVKVQLLNDGGYTGLDDIPFPVEVLAIKRGDFWVVSTFELVDIGADPEAFDDYDDPQWPFLDKLEAVRVEED